MSSWRLTPPLFRLTGSPIFTPPAAKLSDAVNDTYLKANNLTDGVHSYGRMVDLLLAEARAEISDTTL